MDLFEAINRLYTKEEIEDPPSDFMLHRFLSSDPRYATVAAQLHLFCRNRVRTWKIWQDALPKQKEAPFFGYPAPKKKASNKLVERYAEANRLSVEKAEEEVELIELKGKLEQLKIELGFE